MFWVTQEKNQTAIKCVLNHLISSDYNFQHVFHPRPNNTLEEKVEYDYEGCALPDSEFFRVMCGERVAGAFNFVYQDGAPALSFSFIHPAFRHTKEMFWNMVWENCKEDKFVVGIRNKNPRAQKYFEKMGGLHLFDSDDPKNPGQKMKVIFFKRGVKKWPQPQL